MQATDRRHSGAILYWASFMSACFCSSAKVDDEGRVASPDSDLHVNMDTGEGPRGFRIKSSHRRPRQVDTGMEYSFGIADDLQDQAISTITGVPDTVSEPHRAPGKDRNEEDDDDGDDDDDPGDDDDEEDEQATGKENDSELCKGLTRVQCRRLKRSIEFEMHATTNDWWFWRKPRDHDDDDDDEGKTNLLTQWWPTWLSRNSNPKGVLETDEVVKTVRQIRAQASSRHTFVGADGGAIRKEDPFDTDPDDDDASSVRILRWARRWFTKAKKKPNKSHMCHVKSERANKPTGYTQYFTNYIWGLLGYPNALENSGEVDSAKHGDSGSKGRDTENSRDKGTDPKPPDQVITKRSQSPKIEPSYEPSASDRNSSLVYQVMMSIRDGYRSAVRQWRRWKTQVSTWWRQFSRHRCVNWYRGELRHPPAYDEVLEPPCSLKAALRDPRFRPDTTCNLGRGYCHFFHRGAYHCIRSKEPRWVITVMSHVAS